MKFLADECVDARLVASLRRAGHDVSYVTENSPGATDLAVLAMAARDERILLTSDKDFGELVFRRANHIPGLILLRAEKDIAARLSALLAQHGPRLTGHYVVIGDDRFRFRPLRSTGFVRD